MESTVINNISKKANGFLQSNLAFVFFLGGMVVVTTMNLFLFGFLDGFSIDTIWWGTITKESINSWIGWFEIVFSGLGSTLTIWGVIWTLRFDKRFIWPLAIGETIVVVDAVMLGWTFTAVSYLLMIVSAIYNYIQWNKEEDSEPKMDLFNWILISSLLAIYIVAGLTATGIAFGGLTAVACNDVISSGIVAASWYVVLRKSKWGFVTFVITDILYLVFYLSVGVFATGFSYLIYLFIDTTSFLSWWSTN